ncbi:TIGR03032 family protein [Bacteroidota bacterium]
MKQPYPPFHCSFSPNLPELIMQLNCSLAISTYQAGKVIFISAKNNEELIQLPRTFNKAMGLAVNGDKLGIATKEEVIVLANSPGLAKSYPKQPDIYDGLYVPRATYYTGQVDIHDLDWGKEGLWAVNTSFSCLCLIDDNYSFIPKWKPSFITNLSSEDRCHLNGMAMSEGIPLYVTSFGTGDKPQSWRENIPSSGVVIHVSSGEIVLKNVPMPHSPRIYDGKLYLLLSATGEVVCADTKKGTYNVINKLPGFVRGMDKYGDYLFVGLSRLRKNASTFKDLPIADKALSAGLVVIHLPTGGIVGELKYYSTVDEIYDIQVLPELKRPGILNTMKDTHKMALSIPGSTFWAKENETE